MKKNRVFLLSVLSIFALITVVVGVSYAMYIFIGTGTKENTISTGSLSVSYPDVDNIKLNTNSIGEANAKELKFSVNATFDTPTTLFYDVALDQVSSSEGILEDKDIKYTLTKIKYEEEQNVFSEKSYSDQLSQAAENKGVLNHFNANNGYVLDSDSFVTTGTKDYVLKVWIDYNYKLVNENSIGEYSFKIKAVATQQQ